ncbi:MAG: hypothetical protein HWD92_10825 [Flavobacteriia bacterium]|nr:hypothetical protein [Flavobacteriia bacterium]
MKLKHIIPAIASIAMVGCGAMGSSANKPFEGQITMGSSIELPEEYQEMAAQFEGMLPEAILIASDGKDFGVKMDGMNAVQRVVRVEEGMIYMASGQDLIKQKLSTEPADDTGMEDVTVEKIEETREILGYTCTGYRMDMGAGGQAGVATFYTTEDINFNPPVNSGIISVPANVRSQMSGTVLRIEQEMNQMGMEMKIIIEATGIQEGAEAAQAVLTMPEGEYEEMETMMEEPMD